jgi:ATP-dependent 26S proteasome regulatory subunit
VDLSFILNLFDGVMETPGRIIIMTSNHPEKLDHALIRPGRIDVIAKFEKCDHATMIEMIEFFYDFKLSEEEKSQITESVPPRHLSPAQVSKIMFENFSDYKTAIVAMIEQSLLEMKQIKN